MKINVELNIKIPSVPNFIMPENKNHASIPISDFSNEQLEDIGREWTEKLIKLAETRRGESYEVLEKI